MFAGHRIAVVVPAFREARLIGRTLRSIPAYVDEVVVVDDASDDGTSEAALAVGDGRVRVVRNERNLGVGASIARGYREALRSGASIAAVMAGDAQMHPDDLPALLTPVARGTADYTKGNRLAWPDAHRAMPALRFIGNHALSLLTRLATGLAIDDTQCGYTALRLDRAAELPLERLWPRYGYPNDLLGYAAEHGLRVLDVPVRPVYADEQSGIGFRHALFVIPYVLLRVLSRRLGAERVRAIPPVASTRPR